MATRKTVKKAPVAAPVKKMPRAAVKPAKTPVPKKVPAACVVEAPARVKKQLVVGPMARTCPLVLDGEVDAADFSDRDCLSCDEFDCRFCESQKGSGSLQSRLFAGSGDGDADDLDADFDLDSDEAEEVLDGDEGDAEDEF